MPHWPHHNDRERVRLLSNALDQALQQIADQAEELQDAYRLTDQLRQLLKLDLTVATVAVLLEGTIMADKNVGDTAVASYEYTYSDGSTGTDPKGGTAGPFTDSDPSVATLDGDTLTCVAAGSDEVGGSFEDAAGNSVPVTPATLTVAVPAVTVTGAAVVLS